MNVTSIRQKVAQAISKAPLKVTVYRENKVSDGCGGYMISEDNPILRVCQVEGILDNSSKGQLTGNPNPAGRLHYSKAPVFLTVWKSGTKFSRGDYFEIDGNKYEVQNAVNVLNLNIYWQLDLMVTVKEGGMD